VLADTRTPSTGGTRTTSSTKKKTIAPNDRATADPAPSVGSLEERKAESAAYAQSLIDQGKQNELSLYQQQQRGLITPEERVQKTQEMAAADKAASAGGLANTAGTLAGPTNQKTPYRPTLLSAEDLAAWAMDQPGAALFDTVAWQQHSEETQQEALAILEKNGYDFTGTGTPMEFQNIRPDNQPPPPRGEGETKTPYGGQTLEEGEQASLANQQTLTEYNQTTPEQLAAWALQGGVQNLQDNEFWSNHPIETKQAAWDLIQAANAPTTQSYTVSPGDNLTRIANAYGTTVGAILDANPQITNPSLIHPGDVLTIPGGGMPTEQPVSGPEVVDVNSLDFINDLAVQTANIITKATDGADPLVSSQTRIQELEDAILGIATGSSTNIYDSSNLRTSDGITFDVGGSGMTQMYMEIMSNPRIQGYQDDLLGIETQLGEIEKIELQMVNDIRKEVEGEASESYIMALAAKRMQDIYPMKLGLQRQQVALQNAISDEKTNAANIMQYYAMDEQNRYNRMWDALNLLKAEEAAIGAGEQQGFENEIKLLNILKDIPTDRSVEIGGYTYSGMAENSNINDIQKIAPNGHQIIMGIDIFRSFYFNVWI